MPVALPRSADLRLPKSVLIEKLAAFSVLADDEAEVLQRCEGAPRRFGRRKIVRRQGEGATDLYVIREGWAFSFAIMPDGGRQILDLHLPGDIIGLSSIAFDRSASGIATATPAELAAFPKAVFAEVLATTPHLSALINTMTTVENVILIDRLKSIGRMEARDRVAHFLLQLLARLEISDPGIGVSFELPLSQELIGDALGLSSIHVNRTMRRLQEEGHLRREAHRITLPRRAQLAESVDFSNRYDQIRTDWFPECQV